MVALTPVMRRILNDPALTPQRKGAYFGYALEKIAEQIRRYEACGDYPRVAYYCELEGVVRRVCQEWAGG